MSNEPEYCSQCEAELRPDELRNEDGACDKCNITYDCPRCTASYSSWEAANITQGNRTCCETCHHELEDKPQPTKPTPIKVKGDEYTRIFDAMYETASEQLEFLKLIPEGWESPEKVDADPIGWQRACLLTIYHILEHGETES
jgi:hypothetical protein